MTRRPALGVSTAVLRGDEVLLIKRSKPPFAGAWSLPGGALEWGEPAEDAARREVREETGLVIPPPRFLTHHEIRLTDAHVVLLIFAVVITDAAEPIAADDAADAGFFTDEERKTLATTPELDRIIAAAREPVTA